MVTAPPLVDRARQTIARSIDATAPSPPLSVSEQTQWIAARFAAGEGAERALVALVEASPETERLPETTWALAEAKLAGEALVAFARSCLTKALYRQSYGESHEGRTHGEHLARMIAARGDAAL